jgi:uridine kinase
MKLKPLVIGVAGGSGSGKTTIINAIIKELEGVDIVTLQHDSYYRDNTHLPMEEREKINYDHPDALETDLLVLHLKELIAGREIEMPIYDFTIHNRKKEGIKKKPAQVIIVDGILIFVEEELRSLMDVRIFVNTDNDIRFIRRLNRDMRERNRTMESVIKQYLKTVKPMHIAFVQPSRRYAHIIIPEGYSAVSAGMVINMIRQHIGANRKTNLNKK